ncbi:MAG: hypothetical protein QOI41_2972 [Myxococcales bacterium]|nr:hypothetical protein [Myxococcales bacterium]
MRHRVCLGCRTLLANGETCGGKRGHLAAALDVPVDRARLDDEVWGPDSRARKIRQAAKVGASGGLFGGFFQGCSACDAVQGLEGCGELASAGEGIVAVLLMIVAAAVFAVVAALFAWAIMGLIRYIRQRMDKPKPHGALRKPPKAAGRANGAGTVAGNARLALPWKSGDCLAYALELHTKTAFGGGALLRDAMTAGFDVTLDDGRVVRIPPGRVTIVGKLAEAAVDRERIDRFLGDIDPMHVERTLFPYDYAKAVAIGPGDRIDVLGELERTADTTQGHGYRANAGLLTPVGVPVLRIKRRADDDAHYRVGPPDDRGADGGADLEPFVDGEEAAESERSTRRAAK